MRTLAPTISRLFLAALACAALSASALAAAGCDQLNRPMGRSSSSSSGSPASVDAGDPAEDGGEPAITPQPGDIQI